jgi:hypothetical protein
LRTTLDQAIASHEVSNLPATRIKPAVEQTQEDVATLRRSLRSLTRQIQARPQTANKQREDLGITVPDRTRTERQSPSEEPVVTITDAKWHVVTIAMRREDGLAGRPAGISGTNV